MANRIINVEHQLLKDNEIGYYIETPKTKKGERQLPMTLEYYAHGTFTSAKAELDRLELVA